MPKLKPLSGRSEGNFKSSHDWVYYHVEKHGPEWVRGKYDYHISQITKGEPCTRQTFNKYISMAISDLNLKSGEKVGDYKGKVKTHLERRVSDNKQELTSNSFDIKTLEELIAFSEVDMTLWRVKSHVINSWEVTTTDKEGIASTHTNYQVKAVFERRTEESVEAAAEKIKQFLEEYDPKYPKVKRNHDAKELMLEVSIPDTHLGLLAWGEETRDANYDIKIAREKFIECIDNVIQAVKGYDISSIMFPIGNDYFNVDNAQNTTFSGTVQHEDCRYQKSFSYGVEMAVQGIDMLLSVADVIVPIVQGNHDVQRAYYLGETLKHHYNQTEMVYVDNRPLLRKYYDWGKCLIGFDHGTKSGGRKKKPDDAPLTMANEVPELWGKTKYREMHTGHLHAYSVMEKMGTRVIVLPSIAPSSAWAYAEGYSHLKEAQAHLWHKERGKISTFYYKPDYTEESE